MKDYLTLTEIAKLRGTSRQFVDRKFRVMKLKHERAGRTILIDKSEAQKLIKKN